jgi:hypothetical protein
MKIKLGHIVKDRISGFTGVVVARTEWLFGCVRVNVEPMKLDKDDKAVGSRVFDEPQLEIVGEHAVMNLVERDDVSPETEKRVQKTLASSSYGDRPDVGRRSDPV